MNKSLQSIAKALSHKEESFKGIMINGIKTNSLDIEKGDLFIAIKGRNKDGHDFIFDAINSGANAIISNGRSIGKVKVPQIKVANPRRAASLVAAEFYDHPTKDLTVVGITGTNGKTTTSSLLYSILNKAGYKTAQLGTLGLKYPGFKQEHSLTTPDAISLQKSFSELKRIGISHIVMEVSSHSLDQYRVADIDYNIGIFTNLAPEHLDYHSSMESYFKAKSRLFKMLGVHSTAIINVSNAYGKRMIKETTAPYITFSKNDKNSVHFSNRNCTISGISGTIIANDTKYEINSKLVGEFNSENILSAVSAAHALGINKEFIIDGINCCESIPGRMESFPLASGAFAIIDYAHTPDAYYSVLTTLSSIKSKENNLYLVFGAGGDRDKAKRPKMAKIAELFATYSFITPDNPRTENPVEISKEIIAGFQEKNYKIYSDRCVGLKDALKKAKKNDFVVVLGKGREEYQQIFDKKEYYSDIEIIKKYQ